MPRAQSSEPNPRHRPETSSGAITAEFECNALGPDHPEIIERERQRLEQLRNDNKSDADDLDAGK